MMKKALSILVLIVLTFSLALSAGADSVDTEKSSSLTIVYKAGEKLYSGLEIKTYRVADVSQDGVYTLSGDFKNYPVSIYNVRSQAEWRNISSTLAAYAVADKLETVSPAVTDSEGRVKYENLRPGMYLTLSVRYSSENEIVTFENVLSVLPRPDDSGVNQYDVTAYPKHEKATPTKQPVEYKVVKQWKDAGESEERPSEVTVDILKDGVLQKTVELSSATNWSYTWEAPDDGSVWSSVERNIPKGYYVTSVENNKTFIITNIMDKNLPPPPTGDTFGAYPFVLTTAFFGVILVILAFWRKRREV